MSGGRARPSGSRKGRAPALRSVSTALSATRVFFARCTPSGKPIRPCQGEEVETSRGGRIPAVESQGRPGLLERDRKSTRLNSSHGYISYAVFCLKKKKIIEDQ